MFRCLVTIAEECAGHPRGLRSTGRDSRHGMGLGGPLREDQGKWLLGAFEWQGAPVAARGRQ